VAIPLGDDNPTRRLPILTLVLIAANIVIFAFVQPHDRAVEDARFTYEHAAIPCELQQGDPLTYGEIQTQHCNEHPGEPRPFPHKDIWLAVLFSMFLHGSWLHVLGNMLFLWIFGNNVEDHLGPIGFAAFYLVTGLVAAAAHVLANSGSTIPFVGASGAIAGVMGAYLILWPRAHILTVFLFFFFLPVWVSARFYLLLWFITQFFIEPASGVAWVAHVGGFVTGALIAMAIRSVFGPPPQGRRVATRPTW
jgi:membrane associated rhomboid family serine protease